MNVWVVSWTDYVNSRIGPKSIKCFEEYETAMAFAKLMSNNYSFVNLYEDEVRQWDF